MATRVELNNVQVLNSSSRASKVKNTTYVLGKGLKIALPSSEADKFLDLENKAKAKIIAKYEIPEKKLTTVTPLQYDTEKKLDYMYLNFTRVPQDKDTKSYLKNEDDTYQEQICNYLPDEDDKFVQKLPTIYFNGDETPFLPYAGSLVDLVVLITPKYDKKKLTLNFNVNVESIDIVKMAENQTVSPNKNKDIEEIDIDEDDEPVAKTAKKAPKKAEAKTAEAQPVGEDEDLSGLF